MADSYSLSPNAPSERSADNAGAKAPIVIHNHAATGGRFGRKLLWLVLSVSFLGNMTLYGMYRTYYPYVGANEQFKDGDRFAQDKIAVIKITGLIAGPTITAPKKELRQAAEDDGVKAVVLAIVDCPGGTISGSDDLFRAIEEFKSRTNKPIVASMQEMATSGAYYISMPCDAVYADRSCVTGSIGVITSVFNVEQLLRNWGVVSEVFKSGAMKDSGSPFRSLTPEERKEWQKLISQMFEQFLDVILKYREPKVGGREHLRKLADGRVYLASEALKLGLIDAIGYEQDAIEGAKRLAGLTSNVRIVTYSRPFSGLVDLLLGQSAQSSTLDLHRLLDLSYPRMYLLPAAFGSTRME
jgi:protease-4